MGFKSPWTAKVEITIDKMFPMEPLIRVFLQERFVGWSSI